jgi:hypothetical protein
MINGGQVPGLLLLSFKHTIMRGRTQAAWAGRGGERYLRHAVKLSCFMGMKTCTYKLPN